MKDFNSYKQDYSTKKQSTGAKSPYEQFAELASKYEGKSADEIMQAIINEAEKSRKNGTLSDKEIDNFASTIAPLLNDKQRKTLASVVARLKKQ